MDGFSSLSGSGPEPYLQKRLMKNIQKQYGIKLPESYIKKSKSKYKPKSKTIKKRKSNLKKEINISGGSSGIIINSLKKVRDVVRNSLKKGSKMAMDSLKMVKDSLKRSKDSLKRSKGKHSKIIKKVLSIKGGTTKKPSTKKPSTKKRSTKKRSRASAKKLLIQKK